MDDRDIISVYSELESIKDTIKSHSNHLGTLDNKIDITITFLKLYAGLLGIIMVMVGAVITMALLQ